jgi:anthranilate synthase/aminodeoxychorismate synthase-like glutamine amidotransferase
MWLLIDNYDSFAHILLDYLKQVQPDIAIIQNDSHSLEEIIAMQPEVIVLSPGPKAPDDAGITMAVIEHFHDKIPLLGICLGHQALAQFFGAKVTKAKYPMHGKTSILQHNNHPVFQTLPKEFPVMRYHSLEVKEYEGSPLQPIAYTTDDQSLMAFAHQSLPIVGFQFHPESVLTAHGLALLQACAKYLQLF